MPYYVWYGFACYRKGSRLRMSTLGIDGTKGTKGTKGPAGHARPLE